jgi:diguanylate cyclase (GGDEF)-like protein
MTSVSTPPPPADDARAESLAARALAMRFRQPGQALALAQRAAATADRGGDAALRREAAAAVGACLAAFPAELLAARGLLLDVLTACRETGDDTLRCQVLNDLGDVLVATAEFDSAMGHLNDALALARRLGRRDEEARALRLIGTAHAGVGPFHTALAVLLDALALHEERDGERRSAGGGPWTVERGLLFGEIGVVYSNMDQFARAIAYYETAFGVLHEHFPARAPRMLYRMGIAAEELDDRAAAEAYYRRSAELYERQRDWGGRALAGLGIAGNLLARDAVDEAEVEADAALRGLEGLPAHRGHFADALWVRADVHVRRGAHRDALACLERARSLFMEHRRPAAHFARLHERFCRVHGAMGDFRQALEHHQRFHALQMEHVAAQASARMTAMMVQFDTERAVKDGEIAHLRSVELEREVAERREAEAALARAKVALEETNRELRALTVRDSLTGLYNRRHLDERLAQAFEFARRQDQPLSVMICDVDDFKRINDTCSHAAGDEVLRTVAALLRQNVRQGDVVARYGGEEFVVLFPAAPLEQATTAAEKLCGVVRRFAWNRIDPSLAVTISAGVAAAAGHVNHEKLLHDADRKLYDAKLAGKNRVAA